MKRTFIVVPRGEWGDTLKHKIALPAYAYDKRGNPTHQDRNGYVLTNQFNDLNQNVTSRWSGTLTVQGAANTTNGSVTVNTQDAALRAAPGGAVFTATNLPVSTGSNLYTAILTDPFGRADTNQVAVQARDFGYQYDRRGNLTSDGVRAYSWNDADRLIGVTDLESGQTLMTCTYDGQGRRRERVFYADGGSTNRYTYGSGGMNWLVLAITDGADNLLEDYVHGPDLSGSFGGAGGIGGILSVTDHQPATSTHFFHYDGNGNIVTVTDEDEAIAASYEYSPFGVTLVESGTFASRYRFSSKEWDEPVGLYYYGYRYYSPTLGRWINRDPIGEWGGMNLYGFLANGSINLVDPMGLSDADCSEWVFDRDLEPEVSPWETEWRWIGEWELVGHFTAQISGQLVRFNKYQRERGKYGKQTITVVSIYTRWCIDPCTNEAVDQEEEREKEIPVEQLLETEMVDDARPTPPEGEDVWPPLPK